jgi:exopolysaccharide biosynthesis polyprenyl glycosylphosphotransferase
MIDVIRECDRLNCEIFVVPRMFEVHHVSSDMDSVWGIPLIRLRRKAHRAFSWRLKRLFDIVASGLALLLLSPLMALIAVAVRLESGPGVLFRQIRVGFDGQHFQLLKFRSMRPVDETESSTKWNISHDDRMGPIGRFLRKSSLDELPQLINILRGEMSMVGPRPERPHFVARFRQVHPHYWARHRVPSGLTGWAQIHGLRGDTSIGDRARFDNYYVENWSLWLDTKIIIRTIGAIFTRTGS